MFKGGMVEMMKKAKQMQEDMESAKQEIKLISCRGESASGAIKVDLNGDYKISVEDVLFFNQSWLQSSTDLGPVSGNPPYLFPSPDGDFGLNDLAAFGKMWIWYYHEYQTDSLFVSSLAQNSDIKTDWGGNTFKFAVPENSYGAEIIFFNSNFDLDNFHFSNRKNSSFYFTSIDSNYNSLNRAVYSGN